MPLLHLQRQIELHKSYLPLLVITLSKDSPHCLISSCVGLKGNRKYIKVRICELRTRLTCGDTQSAIEGSKNRLKPPQAGRGTTEIDRLLQTTCYSVEVGGRQAIGMAARQHAIFSASLLITHRYNKSKWPAFVSVYTSHT